MKTSPRQPSRSGREKSMFSQADFPVSPSAMQKAEKERKMTATLPKCYERFGRYSPLGSLLKNVVGITTMVQPSSVTEMGRSDFLRKKVMYVEKNTGTSSMPSVKPLSEKDMKSNRLLFQLVPQERPIEEKQDMDCCPPYSTQGLETLQQEGQDGVSAPAPPPYAYSCGGDQVHHQAQFQEPDGNGTDSSCHERKLPSPKKEQRKPGVHRVPVSSTHYMQRR